MINQKNNKKNNQWKNRQLISREIISEISQQLQLLFNTNPISVGEEWIGQMSSIILPDCDTSDLYQFLKSKNIEVPIILWNGYCILRISIQAYNSINEIDILINHLKEYFKYE